MEVLEAIKMRRSVRVYSPDPIPADVLDRMSEALRFAPSACNHQPWHFIWVKDAQLRSRLAAAANNLMKGIYAVIFGSRRTGRLSLALLALFGAATVVLYLLF